MVATRIRTAIGNKIAKEVDKAMDKNKSSKTSPKDTQGSSTKANPAPPKRSTAQAKK
jgi:hypothetical protein